MTYHSTPFSEPVSALYILYWWNKASYFGLRHT